jgi:hypothetical protein
VLGRLANEDHPIRGHVTNSCTLAWIAGREVPVRCSRTSPPQNSEEMEEMEEPEAKTWLFSVIR